MRLNLDLDEALRRAAGATVWVVLMEPQPIRESDFPYGQPRWKWRIPATGEWCGGWRPEDFNRASHLPCRPGDPLLLAEPYIRYQIVRRVKMSDGRSFSEVDDGQVAYQSDGHDLPADAAHHYHGIGTTDIEHVEVEDGDWRPASELPDWALQARWEQTGRPVVKSVAAKMLGTLTNDDAEACGFLWKGTVDCPMVDFHEWWTAKHGSWNPKQYVWVIEAERSET